MKITVLAALFNYFHSAYTVKSKTLEETLIYVPDSTVIKVQVQTDFIRKTDYFLPFFYFEPNSHSDKLIVITEQALFDNKLDIRPAPVYKSVPLNVCFIESTSLTSKIETPKVIKKEEKKKEKRRKKPVCFLILCQVSHVYSFNEF